MKSLKILRVILFFLMINKIRNESLSKNWQTICKIYSCEATIEKCIENGCLGKASCKSCVETYQSACSRCVDDIYDESTQIALPDNNKKLICDVTNKFHLTVCNFYCRSLFKIYFKCEIMSDIPVCDCKDGQDVSTTTSTTTTTTNEPDYPSNL